MNNLSIRLKAALAAPSFEGTRKSVFFHPSAASVELEDATGRKVIGSCHREQYYRLTEEPVTGVSEIDYQISAMLGDKVSELIVELLDTHGFKMGLQRLAVEHSFYDPRVNVSGRCDIIAWDFINNEPVGLEIKSVGEYKATKTMDMPADEHIMQTVLYLDYYKTYMPKDNAIPTKWYIWYFSRTENYSIKAKKHGSPLTMLWDYYITLDDEGVPTVHSHGHKTRMPHLSVANIHARYNTLASYLAQKILPPRDYELRYSEEKLTTLSEAGLLRKADTEAIGKWLKKGAPKGKLKLDIGDFSCKLCPWKEECWGLPKVTVGRKSFNLPEPVAKKPEIKNPDTNRMW